MTSFSLDMTRYFLRVEFWEVCLKFHLPKLKMINSTLTSDFLGRFLEEAWEPCFCCSVASLSASSEYSLNRSGVSECGIFSSCVFFQPLISKVVGFKNVRFSDWFLKMFLILILWIANYWPKLIIVCSKISHVFMIMFQVRSYQEKLSDKMICHTFFSLKFQIALKKNTW